MLTLKTELTMHDGTVRDLCFLEDSVNKCSLLISGGAGDCKIYVTDCSTSTPFQALSGHSGHVLSLFNWGGVTFVSGSQVILLNFYFFCMNFLRQFKFRIKQSVSGIYVLEVVLM